MGDNDSLHNQNSDERQAKKKTTDEPVNTNAESDDDADSNASSEYEVVSSMMLKTIMSFEHFLL